MRPIEPLSADAEWVESTLDLADACLSRSGVEDIETAIRLYESVLRSLPPRSDPDLRFSIENDLAVAYSERAQGDRSKNLERAISGHRRALRLVKRTENPLEWARSHANLAAVYFERTLGNRADNIERAIHHSTEAFGELTPEASPQEWAQAMTNLGVFYRARIHGDRLTNLENALHHLDQALNIRHRDEDPIAWATTLMNLALVYRERIVESSGGRNLKKALELYSQALEVFKRNRLEIERAETLIGMAATFYLLPEDREENLKRSIRADREALRLLNRETHPHLWARAQLNLGVSYEARLRGNRKRSLQKALEAYRCASTVFRQESYPHEHALLQRNLGSFWFRQKEWRKALAAYSAALETEEPVLKREAAPRNRRLIPSDYRIALTRQAFCLARLGHPGKAVAVLEDSRARPAKIRQRSPGPGDPRIERRVQSTADRLRCPLIYLAATSAGSFALLVLPGAQGLDAFEVLWMEAFDLDRLHGQIFQSHYNVLIQAGDDQALKEALDESWSSWHEELMAPIVRRLDELGYRSGVLIPTGLLGLLPLASAAGGSAALTVSPSAQALRSALGAARKRERASAVLCGLADPASEANPLAFSGRELQDIASLFPESGRRVLLGHDANRSGLQTALEDATHVHMACHGVFRTRDIAHSHFLLAGNETLEIQEILRGDFDLSTCRFAALSACSSGVIEYREDPDEVMGLPTALLQAGIPTVLSALWPVADLATSLLLKRFYQEYLEGHRPPAEALRIAQSWLRSSTARDLDLVRFYNELSQQSTPPAFRARILLHLRRYRSRPESRPFEHPFYWAGFFLSGVSLKPVQATPTRASGSA